MRNNCDDFSVYAQSPQNSLLAGVVTGVLRLSLTYAEPLEHFLADNGFVADIVLWQFAIIFAPLLGREVWYMFSAIRQRRSISRWSEYLSHGCVGTNRRRNGFGFKDSGDVGWCPAFQEQSVYTPDGWASSSIRVYYLYPSDNRESACKAMSNFHRPFSCGSPLRFKNRTAFLWAMLDRIVSMSSLCCQR